MKVNINVDKDLNLIHSLETTSAKVHDITRAAPLQCSEEEVVYSDKGYQGLKSDLRFQTRETLLDCHEALKAASISQHPEWTVTGSS